MSEGTRPADSADGGLSYLAGARIPKDGWRRFHDNELARTRCNRSIGIHRTVGLIRLFPQHLTLLLRENADKLTETFDNDDRIWAHPILSGILTAIKERCRVYGPLTYGSVATHPGRLSTVTVDRRRGVRLGLHVDNWERTELGNSDFVPNRISINIGRSHRYLLFLDLTLNEIAEILKSRYGCNPKTKSDLTREFLERHPDYPIIRVRVNPGEAYIAPTENIIHDGSSADADDLGMHITIRGRFVLLEPELQVHGYPCTEQLTSYFAANL